MRANTPRRPLAGLPASQKNSRSFFLCTGASARSLSHEGVRQGVGVSKTVQHAHLPGPGGKAPTATPYAQVSEHLGPLCLHLRPA